VGGEVLKVLQSAEVEGFEPLEETDLDPVRTMARAARLPPYAEY
jgi:hypothetical protein